MITFRKFAFGRSGLGNQLFQYAGTRLYAERNNYNYAIPYWIGVDIFENISPWTTFDKTKSFFLKKTQLNDLPSYSREDILPWLFHKDRRLPHTHSLKELYKHPRNNIDFYGYMQDEYSFSLYQKHRKEIQSWFNFRSDIREKFASVLPKDTPWIGLHIRKGDFVKIGIDLPISTYLTQLDAIRKDYPDHKIFIATNAPEIISEFKNYNIITATNPMPSLPGYVFDFWMLSQSDVVISGGSTFSWWAAFLGKSEYYYSPLLTHLWTKDYVPTFEKRFL